MKKSNENKIGILAAVGILLLIAGYIFFQGKEIFQKETVLYGLYDRIEGLNVSDPVKINGLPVGKVKHRKLLPGKSGKIVVKFKIDKKINLPIDTKAEIGSAGLLGGNAISLVLGKSDTLLKSGDTIMGNIKGDLKANVTQKIKPVKTKATELGESVDSVVKVISYLTSKNKRQSYDKSFTNLNMAIASFNRTSSRYDTLMRSQNHKINKIKYNVNMVMEVLDKDSTLLDGITADASKVKEDIANNKMSTAFSNTKNAIAGFSTAGLNASDTAKTAGASSLLEDDQMYRKITVNSYKMDSFALDLYTYPSSYFRLKALLQRF